MKSIGTKFRFRKYLLYLIFTLLLFNGCSYKPDPEPLPLSVKSTLNLLQENPQFVMYLNFKNMRRTEFWQKNISDSMLNIEKTFGSLLNTFKLATGASISEGVDELYYSNSWFGENAIVLRGIFDKEKLNNYLTTDSIFSITKNANGLDIYIKNDNGLYFYFRDDFTICASNYLKQIDIMTETKDTSVTGLLQNKEIYNAINNIIYKQDLWMVTNEKFFIKGIFQNFIDETIAENKSPESDSLNISESENDTALAQEKPSIENLYKRFNAICFSAKMDKELKLLIQGECINEETSKYLRSILNGLITVAKLNASGKKQAPSVKLLNKIKLNRYDESVFIELNVDESNLQELRKTNLMSEPETN